MAINRQWILPENIAGMVYADPNKLMDKITQESFGY